MARTARLEALTKGALVKGLLPDRAVKVVDVAWHGSSAVTLTYVDDVTGGRARSCSTAMTSTG